MNIFKKKYAIFGGDCFYAEGGAKDFICFCRGLDEAKSVAEGIKKKDIETEKGYYDKWLMIAEAKTMKPVMETFYRSE